MQSSDLIFHALFIW